MQGTIYSAKIPFNQFQYNNVYNVNDRVFWKNHTYNCLVQTPLLDHDAGLQFRTIEGLPLANVAPDDTTQGTIYWQDLGAYTVAVNTDITDTSKWLQFDNRDQQLVMYMIDIALYHVHSRIAPRNIPELRVKRYDDAIAWLKMAARGEITAQIPLIQPKQGNRIRFGGCIRNINSY